MAKKGEKKVKKTRATKRTNKTDWQLAVGLVVVLGLLGLVAMVLPDFLVSLQVTQTPPQDEVIESEVLYAHPLTGERLSVELEELPQVFGVMIDNNIDAWPSSGIDKAFLVIEAPVEAGIPRMLAFFHEGQEVEKIGPVRSARPYYLDWNSELDALYAHVGGSNAALDLIASGGTFDFNQYWWGAYYWRATDRYAPHNVYTSIENLQAFYEKRSDAGVAPTRLYGLWEFKDFDPSTDMGVSVSIDYNAPVYTVDWIYNSESGRYERRQYGSDHITQAGDLIRADNVAIVITDISIIDSVGRRDLRTTGKGVGYVLQDGKRIEVRWEKPSASERLRFYRAEKEIIWNAGVTWIEVIGSEEMVTFE